MEAGRSGIREDTTKVALELSRSWKDAEDFDNKGLYTPAGGTCTHTTVTLPVPFQQGLWAEEAMINRHQYSEQG